MQIPFDERWIRQIEKQYGSKHQWEQPDIYRVATSTNMSSARILANRFVSNLPSKVQNKLIPRLRKGTSFSDAFHEVVVGAMLAEYGPIPGYEPQLTTEKTPDWYVAPRGGEIGCVVEVVSRNTADRAKKTSLDELVLRLKEIPHHVVLNVEFGPGNVNLSTDTFKQIASDVRRWLESSNARTQPTMQRGDITFTVLSWGYNSETIEVILDPVASWVDPNPLRKVIAKKTETYATICRGNSMAFVVAVIADPVTGLDAEDAKSVLFGTLKYPMGTNKITRQVLLEQPYRSHDGIFEHYHDLNAVAWVEQNGQNAWISTLYQNPTCSIILPDQVLNGMQSTLTI